MTTYPQKKLKLKNGKNGTDKKLENSFLIITSFIGNILSLKIEKFAFFKSAYNSWLFDTLYDPFQEKKIHLSEGPILTFINTKTQKKIETPQNKENAFSKIVLDIFCRSKTTWSVVNLKKSLDPTM